MSIELDNPEGEGGAAEDVLGKSSAADEELPPPPQPIRQNVNPMHAESNIIVLFIFQLLFKYYLY